VSARTGSPRPRSVKPARRAVPEKATGYARPSGRAGSERGKRTGRGGFLEGSEDGAGLSIGIVLARFNEAIGARLLDGARSALARAGVRPGDIDEARVPGAFELPQIARRMALSKRYDAIVCLGAVVRGDTPHFDFVAGESARGIARAAEETGVPVLFGVLTVNTMEQAMDRSGGAMGNRGADAARAAVEMARLAKALRSEYGR
jgi:6,7-dimethyl-8-ribityllumazine synthase